MVIVDFTPEAFTKVFGIPVHEDANVVQMDEAQAIYDQNLVKCKFKMNENWFREKRPHSSKILKKTYRSDFNEEYGDMVTLLGRIMGLPHANMFEE